MGLEGDKVGLGCWAGGAQLGQRWVAGLGVLVGQGTAVPSAMLPAFSLLLGDVSMPPANAGTCPLVQPWVGAPLHVPPHPHPPAEEPQWGWGPWSCTESVPGFAR